MFQRTFLFAAIASLACLCMTIDSANAQKGGGAKGGGTGPRPGGAPAGGAKPGMGVPKGGGQPGYPNPGFGPPYNNFSYGGLYFGIPLYGGGFYGGGYPYGYGAPFYNDYPPPYAYYPPPTLEYAQPPAPVRYATIRVLLPDAAAKVWFDGNVTKQSGAERFFYTPDLDPAGGPYTYRIRAAWKGEDEEMIQEHVVEVTPGKTAVADFR